MPPEQKKAIAAVIAFGVLLFYAALYLPVLLATWNATAATGKPAVDPGIATLMQTVSAGIGGFLATLFGVPGQGLLSATTGWWKLPLALSYIGVYFGATLAAIALWVAKTSLTPEIIAAQGLVGVGLGLAVAASVAKEL